MACKGKKAKKMAGGGKVPKMMGATTMARNMALKKLPKKGSTKPC